MKLHYWILAILAALCVLMGAANLNAQPRKARLVQDPTAWLAQHGHRKLGKFAGVMMKIDFNIDLGKKGKKR